MLVVCVEILLRMAILVNSYGSGSAFGYSRGEGREIQGMISNLPYGDGYILDYRFDPLGL
jgi:hypothetical protein